MANTNFHKEEIAKVYTNPNGYFNNENLFMSSGTSAMCGGSLNVKVSGRITPMGYKTYWEKRPGYTRVDNGICGGKERQYGRNNLSGKFDYAPFQDGEVHVKHYGNNMLVSRDMINWLQVGNTTDGFSDVEWNYVKWWDNEKEQFILVFVNGQRVNEVSYWDGILSEVAYISSSSVITSTYFIPDTKAKGNVWIGCFSFEYTEIKDNKIYLSGGQNTTTISIGSLIGSAVKTTKLQGHTNYKSDKFKPCTLAVFKNHIYYADYAQPIVFVSNSLSSMAFRDLSYSNNPLLPTLAKEGFTYALDDLVVSLSNTMDGVVVGCRNDRSWLLTSKLFNWFANKQVTNPSGAQDYVDWQYTEIGAGRQQGFKHQWLTAVSSTYLTYITREPTLTSVTSTNQFNFGRNSYLESGGNVNDTSMGSAQLKNKSNAILNDIEYLEKMKYWKKASLTLYKGLEIILTPEIGRAYIYDTVNQLWHAPYTWSLGGLAIHDGKLYGYSKDDTRVYLMNTGTSDDGITITSHLVFYHDDFALPHQLKKEDKFFYKMLASSNTVFDGRIYYDYGDKGQQSDFYINFLNQSAKDTSEQSSSKPLTSVDKFNFGLHEDLAMGDNYKIYKNAFFYIPDKSQDFKTRRIQLYESSKDTSWEIISLGTNTTLSINYDIANEDFGERTTPQNDDFDNLQEC